MVLPDSSGIDNGEGKDNENASRACCVAILPSPDENEGEDGREQNKYRSGAGEGKFWQPRDPIYVITHCSLN